MKTDRTRPNPSPELLSGVIQATASRASPIATPETAPDNTVKPRLSGDQAAVISGFHPKSTRGLPSRDRFGAQSEMGRTLTRHWHASKIRSIGWRSEGARPIERLIPDLMPRLGVVCLRIRSMRSPRTSRSLTTTWLEGKHGY